LKLENICLTRQNHVKLIDFGFSYHYSGLSSEQLVSFPYAAPELFEGQPYDKSIDIWSLGVVLYVMVCGDFPFGSDSSAAVADRVLHSEPSYPDHLSRDIRELFRIMFEKDPKSRPDIEQVSAHAWLKISRYSILMSDELFHAPDLMTFPSSNDDIDGATLDFLSEHGLNNILTADQLHNGNENEVIAYKITRRMSIQRQLPMYCQAILMQKNFSGLGWQNPRRPRNEGDRASLSRGSVFSQKPHLRPLAPGVKVMSGTRQIAAPAVHRRTMPGRIFTSPSLEPKVPVRLFSQT
jgi:serine/threonine protein kinase